MTRRITNDEYLSLALRYNEQRTINDSLQKEIAELKEALMTTPTETADEYNERNRIS